MFWCMCICEYKTFILCNRICGWPCFCYFWECCLHPFAFLKFFFFLVLEECLGCGFLVLVDIWDIFLNPYFVEDSHCNSCHQTFSSRIRRGFCWIYEFDVKIFFILDPITFNTFWYENGFFFFLLNPVVFWWWQSRGGGGVHQVMLKWWWWSDEKVEEIFIILFWNLYMYGYIRTWFVLKLNFAVPHLDPYIDN